MSGRSGLTRRELLELGLISGAGLGLVPAARASSTSPRKPQVRNAPRNVIFMVADGMSIGVISLAEHYCRLVQGRQTSWYELLRVPELVRGYFETTSLSSPVTDSSAASTAWASGSRVFNGSVNVLPDGTRMTPIGPLVRGTGRRVGLVTTTRITHATPAGFATVQPCRDDEDEIAPQFLESVDVLMGGGREFFDAKLRDDKRDLIGEYVARGYRFHEGRETLLEADPADKLLGLFGTGHLPFTLDRDHDEEIRQRVPTLAEMTTAALRSLEQSQRGFLLQVEGGRVDHAAHANDAASLIHDQLAFDEAIEVALAYTLEHDDTLLIITVDHGNSNPGLNGVGARYADSGACLERLAGATHSYEHIRSSGLLRGVDTAGVIERIRSACGIELKPNEADAVWRMINDDMPQELFDQHRNFPGVLGQVLGNHSGVGWTGVTHTSDLAILSAFGPGSELFAGVLHHTDAFTHLTTLLDIKHRNPQMSEERARQFVAQAPIVKRPDWA